MPLRCVAAGCSNTYEDGVSLFKFPKDPARRRQWTRQVQTTRAKWKPSEYSVLCSKHFKEDCFESQVAMAAKLGIKKHQKLKPDAVPTIFEKQLSAMSVEDSSTPMSGGLSRKRTTSSSAP